MSYEGNYIDGLMSRKESIYSLLRAKYILYSIALIIPFVLMIPGMVTGRVSVLGCILPVSIGSVQQQDARPECQNDRTAKCGYRFAEPHFRSCIRRAVATILRTECDGGQRNNPMDSLSHRHTIHRNFKMVATECISPLHEAPI